MPWGYASYNLSCGCQWSITPKKFDEVFVGDYQQCPKHGDTEVVSMRRVWEPPTTRFQLGVAQTQETQDVSIE